MSFKLEEAAEFQKGFAFKSKDYVDNGIKIVKVSNLTNDSIDFDSCSSIDENIAKDLEKYSLKTNDIVITTVGSWPTNPASVVGKVVKAPKMNEDCLLNQNAVRIRCRDNFDQKYLYYLLRNSDFKDYIINTAQGSANQASITQRDIKRYEHLRLDESVQKAIAHILSTLDEKIEVNNQINKTLEKMAQAIFKQWFIDFEFPNEDGEPYQSSGGEMVESELGLVPKGWEVTELQDIAAITMGQSPKGTSYNENGEGMVFYQGRTDFNKRFPERRLFTTEPKRIAKKGDILLSVRAPVGDLNIANEDCCIGRGLGALHSKCGYDSYLLYTMFKLKEKFDVFNGEGTVFGSINKNDLCSLKIIKAPEDIIGQFEKVVSFFDKQIYTLEMESRNLARIRDELLPRLMSGEIKVL